MKIRFATINDMTQIAKLHAISWKRIYRKELSESYLQHDIFNDRHQLWHQRLTCPPSNQRILVVSENDTIHGFICCYLQQHPHWGTLIENLHIDKHCWGLGLGKQLLKSAAQLAYAQYPTGGMYLEVLASNQNAQTFYQKLGARYAKTQQWQAPDGSEVTEYVFRWESIAHLVSP